MANIAIFRINYKSDFILTLQSDAGWMTPFCIKFWTGAPSQAYFAGYDGTTYTHCAPVAGDPTKLMVQFDDHHLPIGDLKFQIGYHFTVADFPTSIEDEVINQAAVIIDNDGEQQQVMLDFNGETAPEIEFSLPAYANEAQRIANESQRIANEEQRIATETQRIANEEQRISQEQTRQQNEVQRIVQEQARVTAERERFNDYAKLKVDAIAATDAANSAADLANEKAQLAADNAQLAADKAALAQSASALATEKAQLATDKAALAQSAATLANEKAALAQQKAEYATAQGDYAKAQGDYAKAQAGVIPTDVTRTQTDATFVNGNHDPLFYLRQASSSLAGLMTAAGYTKLNDMPAAQEVNAGLAYDVSVLHPTSGVNGGSTYASLSAALAVIPQDKRKGGMTVKFVQSSDNKYVQYRLMSDTFNTTVTNWQGVDDEPTAGSSNLVESGGVFRKINKAKETEILPLESGYYNTSAAVTGGIGTVWNPSITSLNTNRCLKLSVQSGQLYRFYGVSTGVNTARTYVITDVDNKVLEIHSDESANYRTNPLTIHIPENGKYLYVNFTSQYAYGDKLTNLTYTDVLEIVEQLQEDETVQTNYTVNEGCYINLNGSTLPTEYTRSSTGTAALVIAVSEGEQYIITGMGGTSATKLYALASSNRSIVEKAEDSLNTRTVPLSIIIPNGVAYLAVNLKEYNATTDGIKKITKITNAELYAGILGLNLSVSKALPLKGKTIVCFGESTTEFKDASHKGYPDYIADYTGASVIAGGIGGSRLSERTEPVPTPERENQAYAPLDMCNLVTSWVNQDWDYVDAAVTYLAQHGDDNTAIINSLKNTPIENVDIITILGGGNDIAQGVSLGTVSDNNKISILGSLNNVLSTLFTAKPTIKVYCISVLPRYMNNSHTAENWSDVYVYPVYNMTRPQIVDEMAKVAKANHVQWIDLYWTTWNQYNFESYYNSGDDSHPWKGFNVMGRKVASFLVSNQLQP